MEPIQDILIIIRSVRYGFTSPASAVMPPWYIPTGKMEKAVPMPRVAVNTMDSTPSITAFVNSVL